MVFATKGFHLLTFSQQCRSQMNKGATTKFLHQLKGLIISDLMEYETQCDSYVHQRTIEEYNWFTNVNGYLNVKLFITRTCQPNIVERISIAQNDRAITGFPPPISDQDPDKNFSHWNSPTGHILQQWFLPFTKGRKNLLWQLSSQLQSDIGIGTALSLEPRKYQAGLSTDPCNDFYVDFTNYLILTKDIYPHECNRVSHSARNTHATIGFAFLAMGRRVPSAAFSFPT